MTKAAFKTFHPKEYLQEYYSHIGDENLELLKFFSQAYTDIEGNIKMLEFGGGPTVYPLISAAPKVKEIYFADYLDNNIEEVKQWKSNSKDAFCWKKYIKKSLSLEGSSRVTKRKIEERENIIKDKIVKFINCDAYKKDPLGSEYRGYFDVVNANFVAESVTSSMEVWERLVGNICSLLKKDGILIMTAIKDAQYYRIMGKKFPATPIQEEDLIRVLKKLGFEDLNSLFLNSIPAEVLDEHSEGYCGYKGMIFLKVKR